MVLVVSLVTALLVLLVPGTGWAHGALRRSTPADSARLTTAPRELRLEFTERPELAVTAVILIGPAGDTIPLAPLATVPDSNRIVVTAIRGALSAGRHTVQWQTAGADGHPVRGRFWFVIGEGAAGLAPAMPAPDSQQQGAAHGAHQGGEPAAGVVAPGQATPPATHHLTDEGDALDAESPVYVGARWLLFTAMLVVLGAVTFPLAVVGRMGAALDPGMRVDIRRRAARIGLVAAGALLGAVLLRLVLQSTAMHGVGRAFEGALLSTMLGQTVWGWGWLLQITAVLVSLGGFWLAARDRAVGWAAAGLGAMALAVTPALSGHAAAAPRWVPLAVVADALHVLGAGGWLGSLFLLVLVGVPLALRQGGGGHHEALAGLVRAFSPVALVCAGLTAATGVLSAWVHLPALDALWTTRYGWFLLGKLALLSLVAALGAYNWRRVAPALGDATGSVRLRRSARAELAVGGAVLLVTAILVATPTPLDGMP